MMHNNKRPRLSPMHLLLFRADTATAALAAAHSAEGGRGGGGGGNPIAAAARARTVDLRGVGERGHRKADGTEPHSFDSASQTSLFRVGTARRPLRMQCLSAAMIPVAVTRSSAAETATTRTLAFQSAVAAAVPRSIASPAYSRHPHTENRRP